MPDIDIIPTYTVILAAIPPVDIITYYIDGNAGAVWQAFINDQYQVINGLNVSEGYGIIIADSSIVQALLSIYVDNDGHLFFSGLEAAQYSLDANGHLIYTVP